MEARNMKSLGKLTFWSWNIRINKDETCGNKIKWAKQCRVTTKRLSIYKTAWDFPTVQLQIMKKKIQNTKIYYYYYSCCFPTLNGEGYQSLTKKKKNMFEPKICLKVTRQNLGARLKIMKKLSEYQINQS
jgi:hypothetical protein